MAAPMGFDGARWCLLAVFGVGCLMVSMVLVGGTLVVVVGVSCLVQCEKSWWVF